MRRLVTTAVIGLVFVFATSAVAEPLATDAAAVKKKKKCFKKKHGKRVRVKCPKKKKPATQTPTTQTPTTTTPTTPTSDPVRERFLFLMSGEMLKYFANGS